jgi:hypothetical protein
MSDLEWQLAQAEKTLPFVPPGEYDQTRAQLEEIKRSDPHSKSLS